MKARGSSRRPRPRAQAQPAKPGGSSSAPTAALSRGWILPLVLVAVVGAGIWYFVFREDSKAKSERLLTEARHAMDLFEYAKAELLLHEAIAVQPSNGLLYHNLAIVQLEQGRNDDARNSYELSASLYTPDQRGLKAEEYFQLATLDYKEEKYRDAARHLRQAIDANPKPTLYHTRLIDLQLSLLKAPASADSSTMRFLALCGRTPRNFLDAGEVHYRRGSYEAAESLARAALSMSDTIPAQVMLANARWKLRHFDEGLAGLEEPLRLHPHAVELWVARASLLIGAKRYEEAHASLAQALEISPKSYEANFAKLMAFTEAKRLSEALEQAKVCLPLVPNDNEERFVRGMIMNLESQVGGSATKKSGRQAPASSGATHP